MSALTDARAHLGKAREFLDAAEVALDLGYFNAAASNAVISGINSKDAICLRLTGRSGKSDHSAAVGELSTAGGSGPLGTTTKKLAQAFGRLLQLKHKSQYESVDVARSVAENAVKRARQMVEGAIEIVAG